MKDGYFVHFFAPENLKPLPKHVIFILDTSGSMYGMRIQQLKKAMGTILAELKENEDYFHLVEFNSMVKVWNIGDNSKNVVIQNDFKNLSITEVSDIFSLIHLLIYAFLLFIYFFSE